MRWGQAGRHSRSRVLDLIRSSGQISRVELARASGLNDATISQLVRQMITDNLVIETGFSRSTGGKPRTLLDLNRSAHHAIGVSLDYERLTFVVTDLSGHLVGRSTVEGPGQEHPRAVVPRLASEVTRLLNDLQVDRSSVVGVGLASPGPLDSSTGSLQGQRLLSRWNSFPLEDQLERQCGYPVVLDNDATCAALGEHWTSRRGPAAPVSATVYMADGIGCGILIDGAVFHGTSGNVGEIGHVTLDATGPQCSCGSRGCVELYASPRAVVAKAMVEDQLVHELRLRPGQDATRTNYATIAKAAARGHVQCQALISEAATYLGDGIVILSNILDLDEVYLSGPGFADAGAIYAHCIQQRLAAGTFMRNIHPVQVKISHIGTDAAALGAAALVLQQKITPHSAVASLRRPANPT